MCQGASISNPGRPPKTRLSISQRSQRGKGSQWSCEAHKPPMNHTAHFWECAQTTACHPMSGLGIGTLFPQHTRGQSFSLAGQLVSWPFEQFSGPQCRPTMHASTFSTERNTSSSQGSSKSAPFNKASLTPQMDMSLFLKAPGGCKEKNKTPFYGVCVCGGSPTTGASKC